MPSNYEIGREDKMFSLVLISTNFFDCTLTTKTVLAKNEESSKSCCSLEPTISHIKVSETMAIMP